MSEKKKILWVEDDYYSLKGLPRQLERNGFKIIPAESYIEGVEVLKEHMEDLSLILLDLIIPYSLTESIPPTISEEEYYQNQSTKKTPRELAENGMNLLKYIKQEIGLTVPVIVLSVVTDKDIIDELKKYGVNRLRKFGILPNQLKEEVVKELSINV